MKALTLHQPWASLIANGTKRIETRGWSTKYRGPLAIHAAKDHKVPEGIFSIGLGQYRNPDPDDVQRRLVEGLGCGWSWVDYDKVTPLGVVVATCELVDCIPITGMNYAGHLAFICPSIYGDLTHYVFGHGGQNPATQDDDVTDQKPFGDFAEGRFAWMLDKIRPVSPAVAAKGRQGLWEWTDGS